MHAETGVKIGISIKCQRTLKLDNKKLAYNSNSTKIMIQDMNKVPRCVVVVPHQLHE